ncbi:DUF4192 domain-containing protein [Streptomyces sp. NPDC097619]|uniref:DUF4192 domain-containing protein n=1 Tax=Streptomyces sp. NPDC097619 TaxID=3157228 RepID=UPI0033184165
MTHRDETAGLGAAHEITLRSPGELADALPYMVGFHPHDAIVMVAVHGSRGRFGGRVRVGIPRASADWEELAGHLADALVRGAERRGGPRPDGIVLYLCREPAEGEPARLVRDRLRPLAQALRLACGALDVPVMEALCVSGGRYWSYVCPEPACCPPEGTPLALSGTSVMAARATYAGIRVRGTQRELETRLKPLRGPSAVAQSQVLDQEAAALTPALLDPAARAGTGRATVALAAALLRRFAQAPPADTGPASDDWDDALLDHHEAARLIIGLQDRETRDVAAEWMEGPEAAPALRLWRALARRCVAGYAEHAAAPLSLVGWVAWSTGDEPYARIALSLALRADPRYRFAELLHHACNEQLDPESLRECLREERRRREAAERAASADGPGAPPGPARHRARRGAPRTGPGGRVRPPGTGPSALRGARPVRRPRKRTGGAAS